MKSEDSKPAFQLRKTYIFIKVLKVEENFASRASDRSDMRMGIEAKKDTDALR
ncbi:unnamed protein product, partial [Allacma fusca]